MARLNTTITLTPGTPIQISAQFNANTQAMKGTPLIASRILIQMAIGGTGVGYVMAGIAEGVTPNHSTSGDLSGQLAAATSTAPGGTYSDFASDRAGSEDIDLATIWIDGSAADPVIVTFERRN